MTNRKPFRRVSVTEATQLLQDKRTIVVDIRDAASFAAGHIPTARHAGASDLPTWLQDLPRATTILVCCYHGISSQEYAKLLTMLGFADVSSLDGGYEAWQRAKSAAAAPSGPAKSGGTPLDQFLAEHGFPAGDLNATIANRTTPLMKASHVGRIDIIRTLLEAGAELEARNSDGNTALWLACASNRLDAVDALIAAGINLDNQNDNGATCLMYAASSGKHPIVARLLQSGADTKLESLDGFTALDMAATLECLHLLRGRPAAAA